VSSDVVRSTRSPADRTPTIAAGPPDNVQGRRL
jgi:hypothetical protein